MSPNIKHLSDIRGAILSGAVLALRVAQQQGMDLAYIRGVMAMAEHAATALGVSWPEIVLQMCETMGDDAWMVRHALGAAATARIGAGAVFR